MVDGGQVLFMDNGDHTYQEAMAMTGQGVASGPVHLVRVPAEGGDPELVEISGLTHGTQTNLPAFDPERALAVGYDSGNGVLAAFDLGAGGLTPRWRRALGTSMHLVRFPDTGELIVNDRHDGEEDVVVLDIETGEERARAAQAARSSRSSSPPSTTTRPSGTAPSPPWPASPRFDTAGEGDQRPCRPDRGPPSLGGRSPPGGQHMLGWVADVEKATLENTNFRTVLFTGEHTQLTVMSIEPGGEIGWEAHHDIDQFLRIEQGTGRAEFGSTEDRVEETHEVEDDWAIIIPAGVWHNVVNTGSEALKVYSLYSPPEHPDGTVHVTKAEADAAEAEHGH